MTDYSKIPARELDALVAREVMGWECDAGYAGEPIWWRGSSEFVRVADFRPSTDGRAMLTVLDALRERGFIVSLFLDGSAADQSERNWTVEVYRMEECWTESTSHELPRAVCEAALSAVGGK